MILAQREAYRETYQAQQAEHAAEIESCTTQIDSQSTALDARASEIEHLKLPVEKLQQMLFGTKSEKILRQIEQLGVAAGRTVPP